MAHAGQEIHGRDGFRLRLVTTGAETGGELLEMEATYGAGATLPPEHFHPEQLERFEVLEGAVRTVISGTERRAERGETFDVPAGTPHTMSGDGPARTRWQVTPALRTAEFFERLHGGELERASEPHAVTEFLDEFRREIRFSGA